MSDADDLLLQRHLSGESTGDDAARLSDILRSEPETVRSLFRAAELTLDLETVLQQAPSLSRGFRSAASARSAGRPRWILRILLSAAAVLAAIIAIWIFRPKEEGTLARVESLGGRVTVAADEELRSAEIGRTLTAGTTLETKGTSGRATILHSTGARIQLGGDTALGLHGRTELVLTRGSIHADVPSQPPSSPLILRTPDAEVRVLGTSFTLSVGAVSRIEMKEGQVLLTRTRDARSVAVKAGYVASTTDLVPRQIATELRSEWSDELSPYPPHPTAGSRSVEDIYSRTTSSKQSIAPEDARVRKDVIRMYKAAGIDLSLDRTELLATMPQHWSRTTPQPLSGDFLQPLSIDAPYYHAPPKAGPATLLPSGYINSVHLSTLAPGGDGWGVGIVISSPRDPDRSIRSAGTGQTFTIPVRPEAAGDPLPKHLSFINAGSGTVVHTWGLSRAGSSFEAAYTPGPFPLATLGIGEGTSAAQISDIGPLLRSGEATDPSRPIPHALAGPGRRFWKAMVYPATNWDSSTGNSDGGDGLVPYGGLVRLDPDLDLKALKLPFPALRILEAIQTYGWYFIGTGVRDLDVWSSATGAEFAPYGGVEVVDQAVRQVLASSRLFVVLPRIKT